MSYDLSTLQNSSTLLPPRIILLGVEKIGKSTFAASADNPCILPMRGEQGIDDLRSPADGSPLAAARTPTCNSYQDVLGWLGQLYMEQHDYGTVVLDSVSALEPLIWEEVCQKNGNVPSIEKVGGGYSKGYVEALYAWRQLTEALDALRRDRKVVTILIGHVKVKRFDDPCGDSYDQYQFDINDKAANLLYRWADVILFANTKVVVRKEDVGFGKSKHQGIDVSQGQRFLYTQKRPAHPGGGRGVFGRLPYELPFSWNHFQDAVSSVM